MSSSNPVRPSADRTLIIMSYGFLGDLLHCRERFLGRRPG